MKKSFKFWGIILCLFLMIPTANALTQEQAREKILAEDIVVANLNSMDYSYTVGTKLNDRMNNLGIGGHITMKGCTYTTCSFTVSYYDYETSSQITFDVDDFAIKKYGLVFENDDIIRNHVGDTLTLNYTLLNDKYEEVQPGSSRPSIWPVNYDDNVIIKDKKVTFKKAGIYQINISLYGEDDEPYYSHIIVMTDTQDLVNDKLNKMTSYLSDRRKNRISSTTIEALEENLKREILELDSDIYAPQTTNTKKVDGEESKYNLDFTCNYRDIALNFKKDNLLVYEEGIIFDSGNVKMNLTDKKTYQVDYTLFSDSVTWTSSNTKVATVSNTGLVTAVGSGAAIITAKLPNNAESSDFVVLVEDNGEKKAYLNGILDKITGEANAIDVSAISSYELLDDEALNAVYDKISELSNDDDIIVDIDEWDEENYRYAKVKLGYGITLVDNSEDYRYTDYCNIYESDDGFDCGTDYVTVYFKYADEKSNFDKSLITKANELATKFDDKKTYVSDTNKNLKKYVEGDMVDYYNELRKNANLYESIANNDGFTIEAHAGIGGIGYFPAELDLYATLVKDNIAYKLLSWDVTVKQVLTVEKPKNGETVIDAITKTVRNIFGNQEVTFDVEEYEYDEGVYLILLDKNTDSEYGILTYINLVDEVEEPIGEQNNVTTINSLTLTGVVAPKEDEHPETNNIKITTAGVSLKSAVWVEENGKELTASDTFVAKKKYFVRLLFEVLDGYEIANNLTFNVNVKDLKDELVECHEELCNERDARIYYEAASKEPVKVEGTPVITISNDDKALVISWNNVSNATKYEVYRATSKTGKYTKVATVEEGLYKDSALTYGTTYYYKVIAMNEISKSNYSNIVSGKFVPNKVEELKALDVQTTQVKLGWTKMSDMTGYEVSRSTKINGKYKVLATTKNVDNYTSSKLAGNTTYYYRVRAYKTVGRNKVFGAYSEVLEVKTAPVAPKVALNNGEYNSLILKVNAVNSATSYEIYRSTSKKGEYVKVKTLESAGEYTDTNLDTGKTYFYKVRACNEACGNYSGLVSKAPVLKVPTFSLSVNENKKVNVLVNEVVGADGYEISRSLKKKKGFGVVTTTEELDTLVEASLNKNYYYRVRAYRVIDGKKVYSGYSSLKTAKVTLSTPTIVLAKNELNKVNIAINEVKGSAGYEVVRSLKKNKGFYVVGTVTELKYTEEIKLNTTYYYKVRSYIVVNGKKEYSGYSAVKSVKATLATPTFAFEQTALNKGNVKINVVEFAEGYEIYRSTNKKKGFALVTDTTELTYEDTLNLNTTYYYKVRAYVTIDGKKNYSNYTALKTVKLSLGAPSFSLNTAEGKNTITLNNVNYAEGYEIFRSTNKKKGFALVGEALELALTDENVKVGTTYYYKVRAYATVNDKKVYSGYSALKNIKTK